MESAQSNTTTVTKEVLLDAASDRVWRALTDKDQMKEWYFTLTDFRPEVGFEFSFSGTGNKGETYIHLCRVTQVIPGKRLQYTWTYKGLPGTSLVTFELTPEGAKTRLRLTHEGLQTFAQNGPDFLADSFNQGWTALIEKSIGEYLDKTA